MRSVRSQADHFRRLFPEPRILALDLASIALITMLLAIINGLRDGSLPMVWGPGLVLTGLRVAGIVTITHGMVWLAFNSATRAGSRGTNGFRQRLFSALLRLSNTRLLPLLVAGNLVLIALITLLGVWLLELTLPGAAATDNLGYSGFLLVIVVIANYVLLLIIFHPLIRLRAAALELGRQGATLQSVLPFVSDLSVDQLVAAIARERGQVNQYQARVRELSSQTAQRLELERHRIARELHDNIGQNLATLLVLEGLMARSGAGEERQKSLAQVQNLTRITLEEVHRLSLGLHPAILDQVGLPGALEWYVKEVAVRSLPPVQLLLDERVGRFDPQLELALFRIAQEALGNAARHAAASSITVQLSREEQWIVLRVADNGIGFDPASFAEGKQKHLGLFSMGERANLAGGRLEIISAPGAGATVAARVPLASPASWPPSNQPPSQVSPAPRRENRAAG